MSFGEKMHVLEQVQIRTSSHCRKSLIHELRSSLKALIPIEGLRYISVFYCEKRETDICIHLHWDRTIPSHGSTVGNEIVYGISPLGTVSHSVWQNTFFHHFSSS